MNRYKFVRKWIAILLAVCLVFGSAGFAFAAEQAGIENPDYSFTAIDGSTVSTKAEGKPKVLLFYRPGCGNCRAVLNILRYDSGNPALEQADVYAMDTEWTPLEDVKQLYGTCGTEKVTFCYDTGYGIVNAMWDYISALELGNTIAMPLAVFINSENKIVHSSTGMNAYILSDISKYLGSDSAGGTPGEGEGSQQTYKLQYYLNGGKNNSQNPAVYAASSGFVLKTPVKKGYTFAGWYSDAKFTKKVTQIRKGTRGDKVLYAKWTANRYTIVFKGNGAAKGKMSAMKNCRYGKACELSFNKFQKKGYRFAGWNTKKNGTGKLYKNRAHVRNLTAKKNGTVILYAQWKRK